MPPARTIRQAVKTDRQALTEFVCTSPASYQYDRVLNRRYHPCIWELEVQSHFRNFEPPAKGDARLYVLEDDEGLAALCHLTLTDDGAVLIAATAVAKRAQGRGYARELMSQVMAEIARDFPDLPVLTRIHSRNERSRRMARGAGFEYIAPYNPEDPADELGVYGLVD